MKEVIVPERLRHPLFFESSVILLDEKTPFFEELHFHSGYGSSPLEHKEHFSRKVFEHFLREERNIAAYFRNKERHKARPLMIFHLSKLIQILFWNNDRLCPDVLSMIEHTSDLCDAPVNVKERLGFIFSQPDHFQAFIQMKELFREFEKKCSILYKRKHENEDKSH
ncbi:YpoC family protein [Fictibacillus aquaticus]|uniref:YpoC-like domain-containing protein n=1 Tax=Fictibacillus aquaticus TaxID=2021314 RepID=A0A235FB42_9BACL|nr:hypothetical protein [Fictibacillus aquaticus]OYD58561.1 hypothetical protein CGZ90_01265 [Fictibacillus aquaticus]